MSILISERANIQYEVRMIRSSVQWMNLAFLLFCSKETKHFHTSFYFPLDTVVYVCVCVYVMSQGMCDWWTWTCSIIMPSSAICVIQSGIQLTGYSAHHSWLPPLHLQWHKMTLSAENVWPRKLKKLKKLKKCLLKLKFVYFFLNEKIKINNWKLPEVHWQW